MYLQDRKNHHKMFANMTQDIFFSTNLNIFFHYIYENLFQLYLYLPLPSFSWETVSCHFYFLASNHPDEREYYVTTSDRGKSLPLMAPNIGTLNVLMYRPSQYSFYLFMVDWWHFLIEIMDAYNSSINRYGLAVI